MAVLRISGTLNLVTSDALQQAVRQAVASQPTRLLLDVNDLRIERLSFAPDPARALAAARAEQEPPRIRVRLRPVPDACRQVRQLVTQACDAWQRHDVAATAALIATELVANAVRHAHTTIEFTVGLRNGRLTMSVRDGSRRLPRPVEARPTDSGGRGLRLVRELAEAWGVLPVTDGKVVWTRLGAV